MEAASVTWRPLGELFAGRGLITEAELETALAEQAATGSASARSSSSAASSPVPI